VLGLPFRVITVSTSGKIIKRLLVARAMRSDRLGERLPPALIALSAVEPEQTQALRQEWDRRSIPVALKVLGSHLREITSSLVEYVKSVRRASPRDVVMVYIPEYLVGRWYEQLLHNQTALRLKSRLFFPAGVMVTSVPWQGVSSQVAQGRFEAAGKCFESAQEQLEAAQERLRAAERSLEGAGAGSVGREQ
jgi:hypothetical protein